MCGFWLGWTAGEKWDVCLSANIDADVFIQFVQPVLEAGDRREVWGPHVGEVRA